MAQKVILKKYPNRRLYNTENSTYVTLSNVEKLIEQGRDVEVIDVKTNEDVTVFILTQIVMEKVKKNKDLLPISLLHLIIRYGDGALSEFFETYLEQTIKSYLTYKKNVADQFKICLELGMDFSNMTQKTMNELTNFKSFADQFLKSDEPEEKND
ncbi:Polyhydroxyalkanoate synthesis repressor PhaR [Candidatus Magnetomoraceae bacterium gMMP-15]